MTCVVCGGELGEVQRLTVPYRSLPGVLLTNIEGQRCTQCGETEYGLPHLEALERTLAELLIRKTGRLSGPEIRFLRMHLEWSGVQLATMLGVSPSTLSRWEHGSQQMGATPDKLLRMVAIHAMALQDFALDRLGEVSQKAIPWKVQVQPRSDGWEQAA